MKWIGRHLLSHAHYHSVHLRLWYPKWENIKLEKKTISYHFGFCWSVCCCTPLVSNARRNEQNGEKLPFIKLPFSIDRFLSLILINIVMSHVCTKQWNRLSAKCDQLHHHRVVDGTFDEICLSKNCYYAVNTFDQIFSEIKLGVDDWIVLWCVLYNTY